MQRAIVGLALLAIVACAHWPCDYHPDTRSRSPDGQYDVVRYWKSCGAMMGSRYGISLVRAGSELTGETDIRVFYYARGGAMRPATATWKPDGSLEIMHDAKAEVITQLIVVSGIPVSYRAY